MHYEGIADRPYGGGGGGVSTVYWATMGADTYLKKGELWVIFM